MIIFKHRCNNITDLRDCKNLEIDVRTDRKGNIILGHDYNQYTCYLEDYLKKCKSHRLAINIKQSGLCKPLLELVKKYYKHTVREFFFFDMSIPDLLEYIQLCPEFTAFRLSEYENQIFEKAKYIWLDFFEWKKLNFNNYKKLCEKYKVIVVSPELHKYQNCYFNIKDIKNFYGICTKNIYQYDKKLYNNL